MTSKKIEISFENEFVNVEVDENDFNTKDFDAWVRTRFAVTTKDGLIYTNNYNKGLFANVMHIVSVDNV